MFDSELLWYLLLGAAYLIFSLMGRRKRPKPQPQPQGQPRPTSLEDALRELAGVATSGGQQPQEGPLTVPDAYRPQHPVTILPEPLPPTPPERSPTQKPRTTAKRTGTATIITQLRDPRSARSAVILSEVLDKPLSLRRNTAGPQ